MTSTTSSAANQAFAELGLGPVLPRTLTSLGYEDPTTIQAAAIPHLLGGWDLLGLAATERGKTAAFVLPLAPLSWSRILEQAALAVPGQSVPLTPTELVNEVDVPFSLLRSGRRSWSQLGISFG